MTKQELVNCITTFLKSQDTPAHFTDKQQANQLGISLAVLLSLKAALAGM